MFVPLYEECQGVATEEKNAPYQGHSNVEKDRERNKAKNSVWRETAISAVHKIHIPQP